MSQLFCFTLLVLLTAISGCVSEPKRSTSVAATEKFAWRTIDWDDLELTNIKPADLELAISLHLKYWRSKRGKELVLLSGPKPYVFASSFEESRPEGVSFSAENYLQALRRARSELKGSKQPLEVLKRHFDLLQGPSKSSNEWPVLLTSYYEPVIPASKVRTDRFFQPLYRRPENMVSLDFKSYSRTFPKWDLWQSKFPNRVRGRLTRASQVVPYYSRHEIDRHGQLQGDADVIAYVEPIDAFFLQIQGSGVLQFSSSKFQTVGYADQNGHGYYAIGRALLSVIPREQMSMQKIRGFLAGLEPKQAYQFMNLNPSYVFFRELKGRGETSLGTPVIDQVTVASDPKIYPRGMLSLLQYRRDDDKVTSQIVLHQDTGGAIKGPGRVDLFWGRGAEAEAIAGKVKNPAKLYMLLPKIR